MMEWIKGIAGQRRPIVLGCIGALIAAMVSFCALGAVTVGPAFGGSVPAPPEADPTHPDITMKIRELFVNRAMVEALPENLPLTGDLDIRPGNRLIFDGDIMILVAKVPVVLTLGLGFEEGELRIEIESIEAAGYELTEATGMDPSSLAGALSGPLQDQIEAGLGSGAQIMDITTDDDQLIITGRWAE